MPYGSTGTTALTSVLSVNVIRQGRSDHIRWHWLTLGGADTAAGGGVRGAGRCESGVRAGRCSPALTKPDWWVRDDVATHPNGGSPRSTRPPLGERSTSPGCRA